MPSPGRASSKPRWIAGLVGRIGLVVGLLVPIGWDLIRPSRLEEATARAARGDWTGALGLALAHLEWHPWSRSAALDAARCLSRLDRADWAEPYYQRVGLDRLDLVDLHVRALALFRANRRDAAVTAYNAILSRDPANILALRRLAAVRIAQAASGEALALADRLITLPEGVVIGHTLAATIHHDIGDTEHAVAEFRTVLNLDPTLQRMPLSPRSTFWTYLGQDLLTLGHADEARATLERGLAEGNNAVLAALLASSHRQLGNLGEAERWWRTALGWNPDLAGPWLGLGRLALQRGDAAGAIEPLTRAAGLSPRDPAPVYSLSLARRRLGATAEADRLRQQADKLRDASGSGTTGTMTTTPGPSPSTREP